MRKSWSVLTIFVSLSTCVALSLSLQITTAFSAERVAHVNRCAVYLESAGPLWTDFIAKTDTVLTAFHQSGNSQNQTIAAAIDASFEDIVASSNSFGSEFDRSESSFDEQLNSETEPMDLLLARLSYETYISQRENLASLVKSAAQLARESLDNSELSEKLLLLAWRIAFPIEGNKSSTINPLMALWQLHQDRYSETPITSYKSLDPFKGRGVHVERGAPLFDEAHAHTITQRLTNREDELLKAFRYNARGVLYFIFDKDTPAGHLLTEDELSQAKAFIEVKRQTLEREVPLPQGFHYKTRLAALFYGTNSSSPFGYHQDHLAFQIFHKIRGPSPEYEGFTIDVNQGDTVTFNNKDRAKTYFPFKGNTTPALVAVSHRSPQEPYDWRLGLAFSFSIERE